MWEKWKQHNIVGRINIYGKGVAKTGYSSTSCASKKLSCAEECVKITKKANINEDLKYDIMVKMNQCGIYVE